MKKILALLLALVMVFSLAACGEPSAAPDPSDAPAEEEAEAEPSALAGTYMYYEDKGNFGVTPWTIVLNEDGTASVTEANAHIGDQVHAAESWTDNGDGTFTTGAWDNADGPKSEFFAEDGSATWEISEDGICQPVNGTPSADPSKVNESAAAPDLDAGGPPDNPTGQVGAPVAAGTYSYDEDKGSMGIVPWIVELLEDGSCTITEQNPFMGDQIHAAESWIDNGDGTFTTGAWDNADGPKSEFFAEDGTCTWKVIDGETCEPVV